MEKGTVPKNLYKADLDSPSNENEHSLYSSISLSHGQVHHVAINTNDVGAVLTWDFDVMRHNVIFTVLYEKNYDNIDKGEFSYCIGQLFDNNFDIFSKQQQPRKLWQMKLMEKMYVSKNGRRVLIVLKLKQVSFVTMVKVFR